MKPSTPDEREAVRLMVMGLRDQIKRSPGLSAGPFSDKGLEIIERALSTPVSEQQQIPVWAVYDYNGELHAIELRQDKAGWRRDMMPFADKVKVKQMMLCERKEP